VPVLPLGNVSAGLAWAYGAVALAWVAFAWRAPRTGLFFVTGALLAPVSLLGLLPLAAQIVRGRAQRAAQTFAAVVFAAIVAGLRGADVPFTESAPESLGLGASSDPFAVAGRLWHALSAYPPLLAEALVVAAAATVLPLVRRRMIAPFGLLLLVGLIAPDPALPDTVVVTAVAATCLGLAVKAES
jgi:hypothetical protein